MVKGTPTKMVHSKQAKPSLVLEAVRNGRFEEQLDLMKNGNSEYPELATALQQISWQEFEELFRRVGQVTDIYHGGKYVGFYWVEVRGRILHLHSLVIKNEFRGLGIGKEVLERLENTYRDSIDAIELGVHESNQRGLFFYQSAGFEKREYIEDIRFIVLRRSTTGENS